MKEITKYVADDGTEFSTWQDCSAHESLCIEIANIMSVLDWAKLESEEYIQHDENIFLGVRRQLLYVAKRFTTMPWIQESIDDPTVHPSWAGRIIDDLNKPLNHAWFRIMCVDSQHREWQQPYYASNTPENPKKVN